MIQPGIFSRFSQPVHFSRFKPDNLLLSTARFSGYNLEKFTGRLNLEKMPGWITLQVQINFPKAKLLLHQKDGDVRTACAQPKDSCIFPTGK